MIELEDFKTHLKEISEVYFSISEKIEHLIVIVNELSSSNDKDIKPLVDKIETFLIEIRNFVILKKRKARKLKWSAEKKRQLINLINKELIDINNLIESIKNKKSLNNLITKIYLLDQEIKRIIQSEKILTDSG